MADGKLLGLDGKPVSGEWGWQENVEACAQRLSRKMEEAFVFEVNASEKFLPYNHPGVECKLDEGDQKVRMLECHIDYSVGTLVAILTHYCSLDEQFEENLVAMVRDKFKRLRDRKAKQAEAQREADGHTKCEDPEGHGGDR